MPQSEIRERDLHRGRRPGCNSLDDEAARPRVADRAAANANPRRSVAPQVELAERRGERAHDLGLGLARSRRGPRVAVAARIAIAAAAVAAAAARATRACGRVAVAAPRRRPFVQLHRQRDALARDVDLDDLDLDDLACLDDFARVLDEAV
jgi:hypothetical protein